MTFHAILLLIDKGRGAMKFDNTAVPQYNPCNSCKYSWEIIGVSIESKLIYIRQNQIESIQLY